MANTLKFGNGEWYGKKDTILAYNDENNNYKPLPFDFSRASSATVINKDGLIETVGNGEPRIDFSNDSKGALLLEPSRTNLVLTSASGTYGNQPASETNTISPDGTNNAVIPTPDEVADRYQYDVSSGTYATNTKLSYSWYRKRISTPIIPSYIGDLQMNVLVNVTQVGSTTQIESDVNGFDRFQAIFNITNGSASSIIRAYFGGAVGIGNSSVAYFGHQLEQGSYATSYIPTQGSAVTRLAESCNQTAPDGVIGQAEGTIFLDSKMALQSINNYQLFSINNGGGSDRIRILTATDNRLRFIYQLDGGALAYSFYNPTDYSNLTSLKIAFTYKSGDIKVYINGVLVDSSTNTFTIAEKLIDIDIASSAGGYSQMFFNNVKLYNTALTDQELQALTTI